MMDALRIAMIMAGKDPNQEAESEPRCGEAGEPMIRAHFSPYVAVLTDQERQHHLLAEIPDMAAVSKIAANAAHYVDMPGPVVVNAFPLLTKIGEA